MNEGYMKDYWKNREALERQKMLFWSKLLSIEESEVCREIASSFVLDNTIETPIPLTSENLAYEIFLKLKENIELQGKSFIYDQVTAELISLLSKWFMEKKGRHTERVEKMSDGILVRGEIGVGKTQTLTAFRDAIIAKEYFRQNICLLSSLRLANIYAGKDMLSVDCIKSYQILIIDDIGIENNEVNNYGTIYKPFEDLFYYRYQYRKPTILITNLLPQSDNSADETLRSKYGERIYDRMREMLTDFVFTGKSKRRN